jgi:cell division septum initiation protein DivIVA
LKVYRLNRKTANFAAAAIICGAVSIPSARARTIPASAIASRTRITQADTDTDDDKDIPPAQVDKYINVNLAMQKNHGLTVEQAASQQGMTVDQFRSLEGKIERDDTLRERVRTALRKAANPNATDAEQ